MPRTLPLHVLALAALLIADRAPAQSPATPATPAPAAAERKPQPRPSGARVSVDPSKIDIDDGDTATIHWSDGVEVVRVLGIDTPETRHVNHDLPYAQPFGAEARGFALGAFAVAGKIELLRDKTLDPYGRTLGYFFLDGRNYSVLVVAARLAEETVSHYGDNGFPQEAAAVLAAAKGAGPLPFESPYLFRRRMRDVSGWMKSKGINPEE
jgi:micrococcal nuclease